MRTLKQQARRDERARNRTHDADVARQHQQRIARQNARMPEPIRAVLSGDNSSDHYDRLGNHGATPRAREEW